MTDSIFDRPWHKYEKSVTKLEAKLEPYDYDIFGGYRNTGYRCTNCLKEWGDDPFIRRKELNGRLYNYCPNCGAKLTEVIHLYNWQDM